MCPVHCVTHEPVSSLAQAVFIMIWATEAHEQEHMRQIGGSKACRECEAWKVTKKSLQEGRETCMNKACRDAIDTQINEASDQIKNFCGACIAPRPFTYISVILVRINILMELKTIKSCFYAYFVSSIRLCLIISISFALLSGWGIGIFYDVKLMSEEVRRQAKVDRPASLVAFSTDGFFSAVSGKASYHDDRYHGMETTRLNFIDMIYTVSFGIPFRSHSLSVARATNGRVFLIDGTVVELGAKILPNNINTFGLVLNGVIVWPFVTCVMSTYRTVLRCRRISKKLCPNCKYSLAGLSREGCCPECGKTAL